MPTVLPGGLARAAPDPPDAARSEQPGASTRSISSIVAT
jgi:hypothetical protein